MQYITLSYTCALVNTMGMGIYYFLPPVYNYSLFCAFYRKKLCVFCFFAPALRIIPTQTDPGGRCTKQLPGTDLSYAHSNTRRSPGAYTHRSHVRYLISILPSALARSTLGMVISSMPFFSLASTPWLVASTRYTERDIEQCRLSLWAYPLFSSSRLSLSRLALSCFDC